MLKYPSGNELRQTGSPEEQQRDLVASFDRLRRSATHSAEYRAEEASRDHGAEELRRHRQLHRRGPAPGPRPPGLQSQLVFNTFHNGRLHDFEHAGDVDLAYAAARAHNRGMLEFCSVDPRLLPSCYVPLVDPDRAVRTAAEALDQGAAALLVASGCPPSFSPSHRDLFGVWARAEEAGIPVVFHVGGTGELIDPHYFVNGLPVPHDFHGGDENFRSVDYMGIPVPPAQTLATLIFDGVLEQFPDLHIGVIEQGAIWVPVVAPPDGVGLRGVLRHEERLQALSMRPTDYVHRQVRFTPYPTEDVGWIVEQGGADLVMFSSDYPHVEGGRRPVERFEASLGDASEEVRRAFYVDNFLFLMAQAGTQLAA